MTLSIEFLAGRYHATSWDHHVNEGTVEWPPSPWRLVRALLAASYKLHPEEPPKAVRRTLEAMLVEPHYAVPPATMAHTRHYMPTDDKPMKVFDAFVAPAGRLEVHWPAVELDREQLVTLDRILGALTYLGRSESWIEVRRVAALTQEVNCVPAADGSLDLWAVQPASEYGSWRARWNAEQAELPKKQRRDVPEDWWGVVHLGTGQLFKDGWSRAPGTRRVRYRFMPAQTPRRSRSAIRRAPSAARFELASAVLPRLTQALPVGERVRVALLKWSDGHPVFVGRGPTGDIQRGHSHAWFLPADDDADGLLDHVLVFARSGFDAAALRALERLRRVWGHGGHDIELTLVGLGSQEELGGLRRDARIRARCPQLGSARVWESHTPFIPPRHTKRRGGQIRDTPAEQVALLLQQHGLPNAVIHPLSARELALPRPPTPIDWYRFRRVRTSGGGRRGDGRGYGFRLRFDAEVSGPIALGYAAHQGLGQFVAIE